MNILNNGTCEPLKAYHYSKCIWFDYCPIPEFVKNKKLTPNWTKFYCKVANPFCKRYQRENFGRSMPDNLLPDGTIMSKLQRFDDK